MTPCDVSVNGDKSSPWTGALLGNSRYPARDLPDADRPNDIVFRGRFNPDNFCSFRHLIGAAHV